MIEPLPHQLASTRTQLRTRGTAQRALIRQPAHELGVAAGCAIRLTVEIDVQAVVHHARTTRQDHALTSIGAQGAIKPNLVFGFCE